MAVSDGTANRFEVFVGPKDIDLLKRINPKLEQVVDFGWMAFLAKPLFLIVNYVNDTLVHNFGWAIVLVTVVINFILFPLKLSNMKSMRKMQALKPQIDAINAKFKNVGLRDPKKGEQNEEVMALYKKHGVNPMGGCLPMLLQMPFFFAFYKVFTVSRGNARRALALGGRPFAARALGNQDSAPRDDRQPVHHAEDDAAGGRRPGAAEDDDVHAADVRLHVL